MPIVRRIIFILSCVVSLFTTFSLEAQNTSKGFYVVDAVTKIPLADALVQSGDYSFHETADENGFVPLKVLPENTVKVLVSRTGYQPKEITLSELVFSNKMAIVYLDAKVSSLQEVRVSAAAKGGIFKTISDLDIHLRPINNSQEVLRLVPGLFIGQHAGGGKPNRFF